jgi:hypothetical protein
MEFVQFSNYYLGFNIFGSTAQVVHNSIIGLGQVIEAILDFTNKITNLFK